MSQWKKTVSSPYFAATAGAALVAIVLTPTFDRSRGVANGQNLDAAAPTAVANPVSTPGAPSVANPNPFGIGAGSAAPNAVPTSSSALLQAPTAPDAATNLDALRERARQLQGELRRVPTTDAEQETQRQAVAELSGLQAEIQRFETSSGQFAAYRQARDAQAARTNAVPFGGEARNAALGANPFDRQGALDASGLNSVNPALRTSAPGLGLDSGEAEFLRGQKEMLTQQYRQLQQTMRALQPNDEALAEDLKREQAALLSQLKDVETRLADASAAATPIVPPTPDAASDVAALDATLSAANRLPLAAPNAGTTVAVKMQKAAQAAALLREAGLVGLANCVANETPRLAQSDFVETRYVPGAWAQGAGLAEERSNPFQQVSAEDLEAIQTSLDDLKKRVETLSETTSNVETQLKLLTRQTVAAPTDATPAVPAAVPAASEKTAPEAPVDAEKAPSDAASAIGGAL